MTPVSSLTEYTLHGIVLDPEHHQITIDLGDPRTILIRGVNERTRESKDYLLKVTQNGRLILQ